MVFKPAMSHRANVTYRLDPAVELEGRKRVKSEKIIRGVVKL